MLKQSDFITQDRFKQYAALSVPRYSSYPTANHFQDFTGQQKADLLGALPTDKPVSVYLHIPFCDRLCLFCGCHTKQTIRYEPVKAYVARLIDEIRLTQNLLNEKCEIAQLHLGGGSPSLLKPAEMEAIRFALNDCFSFSDATEVSVELDPKDNNKELVAALRAIGITRASLGVQDFSKDVQHAINRRQSFHDTALMRDIAIEAGAQAVNMDVLYGLPLQTATKCSRTMLRVVELQPDRIALFGYAHVPWMKKHQNLIDETTLPNTACRTQQKLAAETILETVGYQKLGVDHFAKSSDTFSIAQKHGCLHRNFQGYTTDQCETLIGFGASAISYLGAGYVQNTVPTGRYMAEVQKGQLSARRGIMLNQEDHIRRYVIERLMCEFEVDFNEVTNRFGEKAGEYLSCAKDIPDDLVSWKAQTLSILPYAHDLARVVASYFDAYLNPIRNRHSLAV